MKRIPSMTAGTWVVVVALAAVVTFYMLCGSGCVPAQRSAPVQPKTPACYLAPGPYHLLARLMVASGCRSNRAPAIIVQSLDIVPGQMKCGPATLVPLASGAFMLVKVKADMVVGRLVVTDGKCHIEYAVLALPKAEKRK